jgi:hypothetical protein
MRHNKGGAAMVIVEPGETLRCVGLDASDALEPKLTIPINLTNSGKERAYIESVIIDGRRHYVVYIPQQ